MNAAVAFAKGFVYQRNLLYVLAVSEELEDEDVHHAFILRWLDGQWAHWPVDARLVSLCAFDGPEGRTVLAMGIDGRIQVTDRTGQRWETVDSGDQGPSKLRHLSTMRIIEQHIYVAGMARQVYRRSLTAASWERVDRGALVPPQSLEIAGFNDIDGLSHADMYGVGFYGELWRYNGQEWQRIESPTNLRLQCVRCVAPDRVFACGAHGTVLSGNGDKWNIIQNDVTDQPFWGMEYFQGDLYLATDQGSLFKVEGDRIKHVELGLEKTFSTYWLHANSDILLSVGHADLITFDGNSWSKIARPDQ